MTGRFFSFFKQKYGEGRRMQMSEQMKPVVRFLENNPMYLYIAAIVLLFPALLINLGIMPLRFDGAYRGIVALEMILNNNYIVPTINDIPYYNKPPLFNWLIALVFNLTGQYNEYAVRVPVIVSILLIGLTLFLFFRKRYDTKFAFLNAFFFITGGCMFFGYSSVGLVDFTLAWFMILGFISMFHFYQQKKYYHLFIFSYFFAAAGYMVKGLPAVVFQGIGLLVLFSMKRDFKRLFSVPHLTGIIAFLLPLSVYYFFYFQKNPGTFNEVFFTIFNQSSQKSLPGAAVGKFFAHFFRFPVFVLYNLLPWSLLIVFCFRKGFFHHLRKDELLHFSFWVIAFNIPVYWLSPGTDKNMKYLFFLFPLMYFVFLRFYFDFREDSVKTYRVVMHIFGGLAVIITLTALLPPFLEQTKNLEHIRWFSVVLFVVLALLTRLFYQMKKYKLVMIVLLVLVTRIGFNLIAQPVYVSGLKEVKFKADAIESGRMTADEPLILTTIINEDVSFYIERERMEVLPMIDPETFSADTFYIIDHRQHKRFIETGEDFEVYHVFACEYRDKDLYLIKFDHPLVNHFSQDFNREW